MLRALVATALTGFFLIDAYLGVMHALVLRDASVAGLFRWDASNLLGDAAFRGGLAVEVLGCAMHLCVSTAWAAVFVLAVRRWPALAARPWLTGAVFGLFVLAVMQLVVVPLGRAPRPHSHVLTFANVLVAHVLFFGIPVSLVGRRAAP